MNLPPGLMTWELFERDAPGFQICGVDADALVESPLAALPIACEVTVTAESAAPAALEATERDLTQVAGSLDGRIVATTRTRTSLVTLIYLGSDEDVERFSKISLPSGASISVAPAIDPKWTLFDAARPSGVEEQSMLDFRVRNDLHAAGDVGGERSIDHTVLGLTDETLEDFTMAISVAQPGAVGAPHGDDISTWQVTHRADPKDVTESSWMIRQIAERCGAAYDGWRCDVLVDERRRGKGGRSWFRRS